MPIWAHALVPQTKLAFRDEMDEILKKQQDAFDFIIGCGRKTAALNYHLRNRLFRRGDAVHNIQILDPRCGSHFSKIMYDAVVTPAHDYVKTRHPCNFILTLGSMTWVNPSSLAVRRQNMTVTMLGSSPCLIVLVGGDTNRSFMDCSKVSDSIFATIQASQGVFNSVCIIGSRRTPPHLIQLLENQKEYTPLLIYMPPCNTKGESRLENWSSNPYLESLVFGDAFLVTGDSVSMISEACSTGKQVVVVNEGTDSGVKNSKLHHFVQNLQDKGLVSKSFDPINKSVVSRRYLDEATKAAHTILDRFDFKESSRPH